MLNTFCGSWYIFSKFISHSLLVLRFAILFITWFKCYLRRISFSELIDAEQLIPRTIDSLLIYGLVLYNIRLGNTKFTIIIINQI